MIKPNEIRVGNYVYGTSNTISTILELRIFNTELRNDVDYEDLEYEDIQPIPLTEDILLKCGFVNSGSGYYTKSGIINNEFKTPYDIDIYLINYKEYDFETGDDLPMLSVHQLQNYFFARTGQELTINL